MAYDAKFVKKGNIKVGDMWTFNKLAGNGVIGGCKGTCGEHCQGCYNKDNPKKSPCYVFKSYVQYKWEEGTPVKAHIRNTNAIRNNINKAFEDLNFQLKRARKKPIAVRIHTSGEIETAKELSKWIETAINNPDTPFYVYTKAYEILDEVLSNRKNNEIPKNLFINISIWHEHGIEAYNKWKHLNTIRAFVYDDKTYDYSKDLNIKFYCPAYTKEGKLKHDLTCDKCTVCFSTRNKICGCYSH